MYCGFINVLCYVFARNCNCIFLDFCNVLIKCKYDLQLFCDLNIVCNQNYNNFVNELHFICYIIFVKEFVIIFCHFILFSLMK